MASQTTVGTTVRKTDQRDFSIAEHRTLMYRVVAEATGQTVGILTVLSGPFGFQRNYFKIDDGSSFRHVAQKSLESYGRLNIELNAPERNPETVKTLRQALATWRAASGHSGRRAMVRERCIGLRELLNSLSQTSLESHLQSVRRIQEQSQSAPDDKLADLEEELLTLERVLLAANAEDGERILNPKRHEEFLSNP
jgi:hypothetical protein